MKNYLGINYGHGSSVALINHNGQIVFAIEEGKVTGVKDSSSFPWQSIKLLNNYLNNNETFLAEGWNIYKRFSHKGLLQTFKFGFQDPFYFSHRLQKETFRFINGIPNYIQLKRKLNSKKLIFVGHHLAHAFSLIPMGLPKNALIFVSDTTGEYESISFFHWDGSKMKKVSHSLYPNSIGSVFHQFAYHLGFSGRTGPGTLMALSAMGKPDKYSDLRKIAANNDGIFKIVKRGYPNWKIKDAWQLYAKRIKEKSLKEEIFRSFHNYEHGINLAASIQKWFTEMSWECVESAIISAREKYNLKIEHLGLAGGAALNCQANGEFIRRLSAIDLDSLTVSPWSDDTGTSIGAAVYSYLKNESHMIIKPTPFLGHVKNNNFSCSSNDISKAVEALINGKIISMVSGSLEFGPRALGGRCILANPMIKEMKEQLNEIKKRYPFMPFAPAVLDSSFDLYFSGEASPYMTWTVQAKPQAVHLIPAALHFDHSARTQLVDDNSPLLLSQVLKKFKDKTGCGVLLLTSLNQKGKPFDYLLEKAVKTSKELGLFGCLSDNGWNVH
jgi:carbamoyltransferase